jgi:hypothetical protein
VVSELTPGGVPDALAVRPLLVPVVAELAGSSAFRDLFGRVVAALHRSLWDREAAFTLSLPLGKGTIIQTLEQVAPRVAEAIPPGLRAPVLRLDPSDAELAEEEGGARPWYLPASSSSRTPRSGRPGRGSSTAGASAASRTARCCS